VRGALVEARVLGEVRPALGAHDAAVVPVEVVQVRVVLVGFGAGVGGAACVVLPGGALERGGGQRSTPTSISDVCVDIVRL